MKQFFHKLRITYAFNPLANKYYLLVIAIFCTIGSIVKGKYILLVIPLLILLYFFFKNKIGFLLLLLVSMLIIISILQNKSIISQNRIDNYSGYGFVERTNRYDDYNKIIIKINNVKIYYIDKDKMFNTGDKLLLKGDILKAEKNHFINGFSYEEYLNYNRIIGKFKPNSIKKVGSKFSIYQFQDKLAINIENRFDKRTSAYLKALVIGDKNGLDDDIYESIQLIGIGHLFVISGLHVSLLLGILNIVLQKASKKIRLLINLSILFLYFIITGLLVSVLRVIVIYLLNNIKFFQSKSNFDRFMLNIIIVLIINPFYLFSYGFLLSYIIVFGIIIISPYLKNNKSIKDKTLNCIKISVMSLLISLPVVIKINARINLLTIIFNLFFIPFVSYLLLPFSIFIFFFSFLEPVYLFIISIFNCIINSLGNVNYLVLHFKYNSLIAFLYYSILFILFKSIDKRVKRTILIILLLFLILWQNINFINPIDEIAFIDLPSGEATLISKSFNKYHLLIDTGDTDGNDLIAFLNNKGVKKLDAIFITHSDSDHIGNIQNILNNFNVDTIYIGKFDKEAYQKITNIKKKVKIKKLQKGMIIKYDKCYLKILWPSQYDLDINNNSLVILGNIFNSTFLFTGDIENYAEKLIFKETIMVDYLKVAHHGSITSSSDYFIDRVKFKNAIIMNGYRNIFNFPNSLVIKKLQLQTNNVLISEEKGTIYLQRLFIKNKLKIKFTHE